MKHVYIDIGEPGLRIQGAPHPPISMDQWNKTHPMFVLCIHKALAIDENKSNIRFSIFTDEIGFVL